MCLTWVDHLRSAIFYIAAKRELEREKKALSGGMNVNSNVKHTPLCVILREANVNMCVCEGAVLTNVNSFFFALFTRIKTTADGGEKTRVGK